MCLAYIIPKLLTIALIRAIIGLEHETRGDRMKIITNFAIPYEVYLFYQKVAQHMEHCTTEDVMADALGRYATMISDEISKNHTE